MFIIVVIFNMRFGFQDQFDIISVIFSMVKIFSKTMELHKYKPIKSIISLMADLKMLSIGGLTGSVLQILMLQKFQNMEILHENDFQTLNLDFGKLRLENYRNYDYISTGFNSPTNSIHRDNPPKIRPVEELKNSNKKEEKKESIIKKVYMNKKVDILVKTFINKLKRNIIPNNPQQLQNLQFNSALGAVGYWNKKEGIGVPLLLMEIMYLLELAICLVLGFAYSMMLIFTEFRGSNFMILLQTIGIIIMCVKLFLGFTAKSFYRGEMIVFMRDIIKKYVATDFITDILTFLVLLFGMCSYSANLFEGEVEICTALILIKLMHCSKHLKIIQNQFITTFSRQQYFSLLLIFFTNFTFAHILSILLNAMTFFDTSVNWIIAHGLQSAPWFQRYIWGYYWGTTTMLTVGFGDFAATNYHQAICLIFIQMVSCIGLAYSINCVGNIVNNLRIQSIEKNRSIKTFKQMNKHIKLSQEIEKKIINHFEQTSKIRENFNFAEQEKLVSQLPQQIRSDYLKESHQKVFESVSFIRNLSKRTQSMITENFKRKISHPDEVINHLGEDPKCIILTKGEIGYVIPEKEGRLGEQTIQKLMVKSRDSPKILNLDFISSRLLRYDIKSLGYSILSYIEKEDLLRILKTNDRDYEHYCFLKDRSDNHTDYHQLYSCNYCINAFHTKFDCPKLHYIPSKHHIISKHLHKVKTTTNVRIALNRKKTKKQTLKDSFTKLIQLKYYANKLRTDPETKEISQEEISYPDDYDSIEGLAKINSDKQKASSSNSSKNLHVQIVVPRALPRRSSFGLQHIGQLSIADQNYKGFWALESDLMNEWKYYFPQWNVSRIQIKHKKGKKSSR